jgi:hypothetical protein
MISIQLILSFSRQSICCDAKIPHRSITFLGRLHRNNLAVTRSGRDFNARLSQWIVTIFDAQERPLTQFYVERAAERKIEWLAGAIYIPPNEYDEVSQPEITAYVWLPSAAFDSIWSMSSNLQNHSLLTTINLTVPYRDLALDYFPGGPGVFYANDMVWHAERENPLLLAGTEFNFYPINQQAANAADAQPT